jgi:hypothetical protein
MGLETGSSVPKLATSIWPVSVEAKESICEHSRQSPRDRFCGLLLELLSYQEHSDGSILFGDVVDTNRLASRYSRFWVDDHRHIGSNPQDGDDALRELVETLEGFTIENVFVLCGSLRIGGSSNQNDHVTQVGQVAGWF